MRLALSHCANSLRGLNQTPLGWCTFFSVCRCEAITVQERPLAMKAVYIRQQGVSGIFLNYKLPDEERLFYGWHEVGHHFLHSPRDLSVVRLAAGVGNNKREAEADAVALCALLPLPLLLAGNAETEWPELLERRRRLFETYGV